MLEGTMFCKPTENDFHVSWTSIVGSMAAMYAFAYMSELKLTICISIPPVEGTGVVFLEWIGLKLKLVRLRGASRLRRFRRTQLRVLL